MTKVKPIFISPTNPVGLDKIVAALQSVIAEAFYMNEDDVGEFYFDEGLLLPLALKDEQDERPIIYWKEDDYYPSEPDDNYRIKSFFYQEDSSGFESMNSIQYNLNLVVWFNQDKYARNKSYQIKEFLITELEGLVRNYLRMEDKTSIEVFRELDAVFSNYKLTPEQKTKIKYPYQAFRIRFNISADLDCGDAAKFNVNGGSVIPPLRPCDPPADWDELVNLIGRGYNYTQPTGSEGDTPYRTGDDADIENTVFSIIRSDNALRAQNALADFYTLVNKNTFDTFDRFTDLDGLQVFGDDYVICNYTGAGWKKTILGTGIWTAAIDDSLSLSLNGFDDYFLPNDEQYSSISDRKRVAIGNSIILNTTASMWLSSTASEGDTTRALKAEIRNGVIRNLKTASLTYGACRVHFKP